MPGELEILSEITLLEIPRGSKDKDLLRLQYVTANAQGKVVHWHSLRVFYRGEKHGDWLPGKAGITIRASELAEVVAALTRDPTAKVPIAATEPALADDSGF